MKGQEQCQLSRWMATKVHIAADIVCKAYDVSFEDVIGERRHLRLLMPRWAIAAALFDQVGMHPRDIASVMNINRTSVHFMRRALKRELETNRRVREFYEKVEAELNSKLNPARDGYPDEKTKKPPPTPKGFGAARKDQNGDDRKSLAD